MVYVPSFKLMIPVRGIETAMAVVPVGDLTFQINDSRSRD